MKIGLWLGSEVLNTVGGAYSYMDRLHSLIDYYKFDDDVELCYLSWVEQNDKRKEVINISQLPQFLYSIAHFSKVLYSFLIRLDGFIIRKRGLNNVLRKKNVKIVLYTHQCMCFDSSFPFISINWDIGHRSTYAFPELTYNKAFEGRERFYMKVLPKALLVICESETGKSEIEKYTRIGSQRIRVMPIFAGAVSSIDVRPQEMEIILKNYGLKTNKFFYYPAQFWAHKNHIGVLKAFAKFKKEIKDCKLVFSGSDKGNKSYVADQISKQGLTDDVLLLGFISEKAVYSLYKNALGLIMASHFGPTNMPPIEAMELGCPVACSNIGGHKEILGNNAIYFDSFDYNSIYQAMIQLATKREEYIKKIHDQRKLTMFNSDNALNALNHILKEAITIRDNWR